MIRKTNENVKKFKYESTWIPGMCHPYGILDVSGDILSINMPSLKGLRRIE